MTPFGPGIDASATPEIRATATPIGHSLSALGPNFLSITPPVAADAMACIVRFKESHESGGVRLALVEHHHALNPIVVTATEATTRRSPYLMNPWAEATVRLPPRPSASPCVLRMSVDTPDGRDRGTPRNLPLP